MDRNSGCCPQVWDIKTSAFSSMGKATQGKLGRIMSYVTVMPRGTVLVAHTEVTTVFLVLMRNLPLTSTHKPLWITIFSCVVGLLYLTSTEFVFSLLKLQFMGLVFIWEIFWITYSFMSAWQKNWISRSKSLGTVG